MSYRYSNAIVDPGLNTLIPPNGTTTYYYNLYSWGSGLQGALGLGNTTSYSSPKQVGALSNWLTIASGYQFTLAVKTDGSLWSWGYNGNGQLGIGNTTNYSSPVQIGALTNWLNVACGWYHSVATKIDGTLWTWGWNNNGQLGNGNTTDRSSPAQVGALTNWLSVGCGRKSTYAVKTNGTLWSWGSNNSGSLGLGNTTYYSSPKQVGALTNWLKVVGGYSNFAIALKTDGSLWSWGYNYQGQLGLNNQTYYSSPKQIGALTTWTAIATFSYGGFAINNNKLYAWGQNQYGDLGLNTSGNFYSSPVQVGALTNWKTVFASGQPGYGFAIKTDGTLWSWGYNAYGQLGQGNTTSISSPKQIGALNTWNSVAPGFYGRNVIATIY